jgi:hypothetical protein
MSLKTATWLTETCSSIYRLILIHLYALLVLLIRLMHAQVQLTDSSDALSQDIFTLLYHTNRCGLILRFVQLYLDFIYLCNLLIAAIKVVVVRFNHFHRPRRPLGRVEL